MRYLWVMLLFTSLTLEARMYQWLDNDTGTTQLSGKPPSWYRSAETGPRIFVFDNGKMIDDTGIRVSDEQRILLRQRAYNIADEEAIRARAEAIAAVKEKQLAAAKELELSKEKEVIEKNKALLEEKEQTSDVEEESKSVAEMNLEEMKELIQSWDLIQEKKAKEILYQ